MTNLGAIAWGRSPNITGSIAYEYQRSGADMLYKIKVTIDKLPRTDSRFGYPIYVSVSLDGAAKVSGATIKSASPSYWSAPLEYETGWLTVSNKGNGTTALSVRLYSGSGTSRDQSYGYSLYVVPAASNATVGALTMGQQGTITVAKAMASYTHTIECYFGSAFVTVCNKSAATSVPWTPSIELAKETPNSATKSGILRIITYSGNEEIGRKDISVTLSVPASAGPIVDSITIAPETENEWIEERGGYAQGYSKAKVTVTAHAQYGAKLYNIVTTCDGKTYSGDTITTDFLPAGNVELTIVTKDTRGLATTQKRTISVAEYKPPVIASLEYERGKLNGSWAADDSGDDVRITLDAALFLEGNTSDVSVWYDGGTRQEKTGVSGPVTFYFVGFGTDETEQVQVQLVDALGTTVTKSITIPTVSVPVNLNMDLPGIGIGKVAEIENTIDIAWDVILRGKCYAQATGDAGTITATSYEITKIPLKSWVTAPNAGLSLTEDGGVRIEKAGVYRIGGSVYLTGGANVGMSCFIRKGTDFDGALEITSNIRSATWSGGVSAPPCIVAADVGEVVYLAARPLGYDATVYTNNVVTFLTLELLSGTAAGNASIVPGALPSENYYVTRPELDAAIAAAIGSVENGRY